MTIVASISMEMPCRLLAMKVLRKSQSNGMNYSINRSESSGRVMNIQMVDLDVKGEINYRVFVADPDETIHPPRLTYYTTTTTTASHSLVFLHYVTTSAQCLISSFVASAFSYEHTAEFQENGWESERTIGICSVWVRVCAGDCLKLEQWKSGCCC